MITRRHFIAGLPILTLAEIPALAQDKRPDPLSIDKVKEFVRLGHSDLAGTRQMLEETPAVLQATYDWGNGDFETALGGASHMGRKDIAAYLLEKGARMDIFTAAMMNKIDIVKAIFAAFPDTLNCKGPHGITLLMHAQKGEARDVLEFLKLRNITQ
jgi:ankyrin repeat protein